MKALAAGSTGSLPAADAAAELPLPRLRDDLALLPGPRSRDGAPTWTIHDPARDRYLRIGWRAMEMLSRWHLRHAPAVAAAVTAATTAQVTAREVLELAVFLRANDLTVSDDPASVARLVERRAARRAGPVAWAMHNYLFVRIPLLRPDRFLQATGWLVAPFYGAAWRWGVIAALLLGLFLVSRQWDLFVADTAALFTWDGAAVLAATLVAVKILHEFGHAYTAHRYGCRVPSMGIAFLVLWPVLYTDTTHAYRLVSRRQRLAIGAGGIMVELTIAALATLAWALLPEGGLRTACHAAATVTWIGTLAINLNPLMRFDGYYLLADALDIPNLQDRAFAVGRWWLRELLFGLGDPPPDAFAPGMRRFLIFYAIAVWCYRFVLFIGIALLVYGLAFKLLGLLLMAVEIGYFILRPILRELAAWWQRRHRVRLNRRSATTLAVLAVLAAAVALPLPWRVAAPAVLQPARLAALHAPAPARIAALQAGSGGIVRADAPLLTLDVPDLRFQAEQAAQRIAALQALIAREAAVAAPDERVGVLRKELAAAHSLAEGLAALQANLVLRAPFDGRFVDLTEPLAVGQWVRPEERLGHVVSGQGLRATAYVAAADLARVAVGAAARFIGEDPAAPALQLRVVAGDQAAAETVDQPLLAATWGGPLAVAGDTEGRAADLQQGAGRPLEPVYRVTLAPAGAQDMVSPRSQRGRVWIDGPPMALAERAWRTAAAVLLRESGF